MQPTADISSKTMRNSFWKQLLQVSPTSTFSCILQLSHTTIARFFQPSTAAKV